MYFMLDNYDSFVYNLSAYFEELGQKILVKRADQITVAEVEEYAGQEPKTLRMAIRKPSARREAA